MLGLVVDRDFGVGVFSDWTPGSTYEGIPGQKGSTPTFEGKNLEADPPRRLVQSYHALWSEDVQNEGESRVTGPRRPRRVTTPSSPSA